MDWNRALTALLRRGVRTGLLELTFADGSTEVFGPGGPPATSVTLHDPDLPRKFLARPDLAMGEAYMDGRLTIRGDDVRSFLTFALRNFHHNITCF